ncbi:type I pullulanase [Armatimonas rosea]|uniref:Pullulanase n=1 Tax=Armatimonas rosea TaxID=685828 RepID=A0A7W9SN96_ARMRO|nr:type I pullulanase [Armatimonas rosea]MBB6049767.1 pullulanase [Armatimonas rosea]
MLRRNPALPVPAQPAFLDALDEIRYWLPQSLTPERLAPRFRVRVGAQSIPVVAVSGGEPAAPVRDPNNVVLAGTIQVALGGREWNPAGTETQLTRLAEGVYELVVSLPAGSYAYKLTRGGSWDENYGAGFVPGGANIALTVPKAQLVRFVVDFGKKTIQDSINQPATVPLPTALPERSRAAAPPARFQSVRLRLARKLTAAEVAQPLRVQFEREPERVVYVREALSDPLFHYAGGDLGAHWSRTQTTFTLWSPVAEQVTLVLGEKRHALKRGTAGVWRVTVPGDWHGTPYHYELRSYGQSRRAADIYGVAATADSARSVVADLSRTNPPGWPAPRPFVGKRATDALVYELHVRDFTIHPSSGVKPEWRGKYLGLAQKSEYLARLGVTHVHLLPIQNFNAAHSKTYNWGYETTLFNVPEEQYATQPDGDPLARIREVKTLIAALQRRGLGVVLDVVYNHTVPSEGALSAFWECVPYYYFRSNDKGELLNESGVGNALHDERPMVRKFIRESLALWAREYRIDGFRFDLLGMFTKETVAELAKEIRRHNPAALIYGEPWTGGGPLRFGKGDQRGLGVAVFNDHFRNALRGELDGPGAGFSHGGRVERPALEQAVSGSLADFAAAPTETVNYVSAHDNMTFWDKTALSLPNDPALQRAAVKLAHAAVLLSQGIPFLEGGIELGRTKGMSHNSYDAGDTANQFDWARGERFADIHAYLAGLIALRRAHPALRLHTAEQVKSTLTFLPLENGVAFRGIAFRLEGRRVKDPWSEIIVALHRFKTPSTFTLPPGPWQVAVDAQTAGTRSLGTVENRLTLAPLSATVLFRKETP